jgi:oligopeptide/dipeptide ABC transporter ATP-binding protein
MVFQEPMSALNPVYTVGAQVAEAVRLHSSVSRREAHRRAVELLGRVGLPTPERAAERYPHELSGGMRQRVVIAIAIAAGPALLIADEPTTALDVVTQAQILALVSELRHSREMAVLLVAHDLALVSEIAQRVVVMYAGQVVESGPVAEVLGRPAHPYTRALLESTVPTGASAIRKRGAKGRRLPTIEGTVPDLFEPPPGCRFADRCADVFEPCRTEPPDLLQVGESVVARCHLHRADRAQEKVS